MYTEFTNKTYTRSSESKITVSDNTDFSISGTSKKIVFADAENEYVDVGFTSIDVSGYEELCFYLYTVRPLWGHDPILRVTIDGHSYDLKPKGRHKQFAFIQFDATNFGAITKIRLQSLVENLTLFFDMPLVRKVDIDDMDEDILSQIAAHITLDYGVSTTTTDDAEIGDKTISLASTNYVHDESYIKITKLGDPTKYEYVTMEEKSGTLRTALTKAYPSGSTVEILCPVEYGNLSEIVSDPVCGVIIYDKKVEKQREYVRMESSELKQKLRLGALGVYVYVECSSFKKLLGLSRQIEQQLGDEFLFLLDGEYYDATLEDVVRVGKEAGGIPRQGYFFSVEPRLVQISKAVPIDDYTVTPEVVTYATDI